MKTLFKKSLLSILTLITLMFSIIGVTSVHAAGVLYVKAGGTGNCSSWKTACTLQTALTNATSGKEIWVAAGTHKPGITRKATFKLKNGVAVYGGFAGTETARSQRAPASKITILSGDIDNNDSQTPIITNISTVTGNDTNSYHVVTAVHGATLDGFTITAGSADSASPNGGGMYSEGKPTLVNIIFRGNKAAYDGGGMENYYGSPTLTNVTFIGNRAEIFCGGGMHSTGGTPTLTNVTFSSNLAKCGGGLSSFSTITLTNVTFSDNLVTSSGGGMYSRGTTKLTQVVFNNNRAVQGGGMYNMYNTTTLTDVTFHNNSANQGGGLYISSANSEALTNVTFSSNSASEGGGIYGSSMASSSTLRNVTFNGNSASKSGGGIYHSAGFMAVLQNVTLRNNSATNSGGGISVYSEDSTLFTYNTILWGNTSPTGAQIYNGQNPFVQINDSVVDGGCPPNSTCANVITADPLLGALSNNGGFTQTVPLQTGSSAIDAGNDTNCPATHTDQRGAARPQGTYCDIGAFEYVLPVMDTLTFTSIAAQDGQILESSETSNIGGTINAGLTTLPLGDSVAKQQYIGLLSFNTGSIPDTAIITGVTLKVTKQAVTGDGDPVANFKGFMIDLKNGFFGSSGTLQAYDFQNPANKTIGPVSPTPVTNIYSFNLNSTKDYINKLAANNGLTQIRLRFKLDDNNNALANYLSLYSGNAATASDRPQLVIQYYVLPPSNGTVTKTPTATQTAAISVTPSVTVTTTPTPTLIETNTPTPTSTFTPTATNTETAIPTNTATETLTLTP